MTLEDLGDRTRLILEVDGEERSADAMEGWSSSFEKLAESLTPRA